MSENKEKQDFISVLKSIADFKDSSISKLKDNFRKTKESIKLAKDNIEECKNAIREAEAEALRLAAEAAMPEKTEKSADTAETVEEIKATADEAVNTVAPTEPVAVEPVKEEIKEPVKVEAKPKTVTKTYIPEANRMPENRGYNNNNNQSGERRDRPNDRPRPSNNSNNSGRPAYIPPITPAVPINLSKPTKKGGKPSGAPIRDDKKKQPANKRTLVRKGYVNDIELDENGYVKHVKQRKAKKGEQFNPTPIVIEHAIITSMEVPIKVLAEKIGKTATEIVKKLFLLGQVYTINDVIDFDTAELIAVDFGITLEYKPEKTAEDLMNDNIVLEGTQVKRPPVVTIMGHVDHGKTSLLDYIRKTKVVSGEAGGITQHIGAYTINLNGEAITFLDTPGHEAFTSMRKRGARLTDIAIIVVAADDGIMPQTIEAINHAKEAGVSIMVAINKIDKPAANVDKTLQQLTQHGILPEEWGGDVIITPVSAKTGEGIDKLLENILLVAEVKELTAIVDCPAQGSVIEARLDKGIGPVATILVQNGTLNVSDYVVAGTCTGKVRALINDSGQRIKSAAPSYAVSVVGFSEVPNAGDQMVVVADEKLAKQVASERATKERTELTATKQKRTLEDMFKGADQDENKVLGVLIKGDVQGSVEALKQAVIKLSDEMSEQGVMIKILHYGVGAINESDVMLADTANAIIIGFNVRPEPKAKALADKTKVDIKLYRVIYDMIDDVTLALKGLLDPVYREVELGHAEVRQIFKISSVGTIAGCYVTDGKVARNAKFRLIRDNVVIYDGNISSLKRGKDEAKEVNSGYECGIGLENFNDIVVGDIIEAFMLKQEMQ